MENKKLLNKQFSNNVTFAPQASFKRDPRSLSVDRHDSLSTAVIGSLIPAVRRDSGGVGSAGTNLDLAEYECRFRRKWRVLSCLQITFGLLSLAVNLYSHYPVFSCGWHLMPGVDWLWFGTWIGVMNVVCGVIGAAASKQGLKFSLHKLLRRMYFIFNCSFLPFANGIGMTSFGITLLAYQLICNLSTPQNFTLVVAFMNFAVLTICLILNIIGIVYQVLATTKCKCWICDPKNQTVRGYSRT